jgi:hypothetical protein
MVNAGDISDVPQEDRSRQIGKQTHKQTDIQTNRPTDISIIIKLEPIPA